MQASSVEGLYVQLILFDVPDEASQDRLIKGVGEEIEAWVCDEPGFVSATFHKSTDGKRVMNYARWESRADWDAFSRHSRQSNIGSRIEAAGARPSGGGTFIITRDIPRADTSTNDL